MREVAARFGVSVGTVVNWVRQAHGKRLDWVNFTNCKPGRPWNRTPEEVEQRILSARMSMHAAKCQGEPKFPQVWESKIPHPVHASASSVRTRPAFNFSLSRYELPRMLSVTA